MIHYSNIYLLGLTAFKCAHKNDEMNEYTEEIRIKKNAWRS